MSYFFFDYVPTSLGGSVLGQKSNLGTDKKTLVALYPIEELAPNQFPKFLTFSATSLTALSGICYVNLEITKAFHIPLSSDLKFAQFYSTSATAAWDDRDLSKLEGKTATQALALGLQGKIVLIGDSTQTFRQQGKTNLGPYVYRDSQGAVQITKFGTIFEVTPLQLQPLSSVSTSSLSERIVYTPSTPITPQNNDWILVDGVGSIYLPDLPSDGFRFTLDDRKFRRLDSGRNSVVPASGTTIGVGQTTTVIDHLTPLTWGIEDKGSFSSYIYEAAANNWTVLLTRESEGTAITQSARPLIVTTNADSIAQPYDSFYLGGNTSIYVNQLVTERQFIDIQWAVGATWNARVVCPVGFTMGGVFEDLTIVTSLTSVTRLQITLGANNNFQIS